MLLCISITAGFNAFAGKPTEINYELTCSARPDNYFPNIQNVLVITSSSEVDNSQIHDLSQLPNKTRKRVEKSVKLIFTPNTDEFVDESVKSYARACGIKLGYDRTSDYNLKVNLKELKLVDGVGSAPCTAVIEWELFNPQRQLVLDGLARGKYTLSTGQSVPDALDKAFSKAIKDIDWNGIIKLLGTEQTDNAQQVTGEGNTDLEHTVIRWYILSTPAGADVSWRIVSSTPAVRNTNANYVGTTPYESTESFDIKGLTPETAGNVQIEVTCDKPGYMPQKKRFNLLQAIDQKEISAKFNLVKEEE